VTLGQALAVGLGFGLTAVFGGTALALWIWNRRFK
jgi:hypothetical protein